MRDDIQVTVRVNQEVETEVSVGTLISVINAQPMTDRWNVIAQLLNEINVSDQFLVDGQKDTVVRYLKSKLEQLG